MQLPGLIIGAGIGGTAAAIALRNTGINCRLFEQAPQSREAGAGITLWANAIKAIERLGLRRAYDQISCPAGASLYDSDGRLLLAGGQLSAEFNPVATVVHRGELLDMLVDAYGRDGIKYGARCIGIDQSGDKVVASFEDGSRVEGEFIIGADGLHSVVREHLFGVEKPVYAGYTAWRAIVEHRLDEEKPGERWGPGGRFGYIPMTKGRTLWFATLNVAEHRRAPHGEKALLLERFGDWRGPVRQLIERTSESAILRNEVYDRPPLLSWTRGRVTLLGDAAHAIAPVLGQGACLALEDAVVLAQCLRSETNTREALMEYERRRLPRANFFIRQARIVGSFGQLRSPLLVGLRNMLVRSLYSSSAPTAIKQMLTVEL
ncbi:MAG TPA: FAD-dependent monooxygenase [Planktothrix sp.]|jgi:2-polyprenyl-6-methoxyphenol hydroxylase-like FAD-dependent oxidoreductase